MCVIYACSSAIPSLDLLKYACEVNADGNGVAWFGKDKRVHFKKDFPFTDPSKIHQFIGDSKLPFPLMIHFRNATMGDPIPELAHPFPITLNDVGQLEGVVDGVIMHNGTVEGVYDEVKAAVLGTHKLVKRRKNRLTVPGGKWSDSRALAWLAAAFGIGYLELAYGDKRIAIMTEERPGKISILGTKQWYDREGWKQSEVPTKKSTSWANNWGTSYDTSSDDDWFRNKKGVLVYDPDWSIRRKEGGFAPSKSTPSWETEKTKKEGKKVKQMHLLGSGSLTEAAGKQEHYLTSEVEEVTSQVIVERKERAKKVRVNY